MSGARAPQRLGLWLPWAAFAAAMLGWFAYWLVLKDQALARFEAAAAAHRAAGGVAAWRSVSADGFPFRLSFRFADLALGARDGAWRLDVPRASLHVNPVDPLHVLGAPDASFTLTHGGRRAELSAREAGFSVRFTESALARVSLQATDLSWRDAEGAATVGRLLLHLRPDPRTAGAAQVALEIDAWKPPRIATALAPLGPEIAQVRAAIVVDAYARALDEGLRAWAASGGALRMEAGELRWGPAAATATGRFVRDEAGRFSGQAVLVVADPAAAFGPLAAAPNLPGPARVALSRAAAAPAPLSAPLDLANGVLSYAGLVPLLTMPAPAAQSPSP
ncbi:MAG: DUF2125 domain-containing protein [Alphaproteobacteria bacterium]|nr:DUF2125 domain-containing protein [Alphaproteobacteria bacterium]